MTFFLTDKIAISEASIDSVYYEGLCIPKTKREAAGMGGDAFKSHLVILDYVPTFSSNTES